MRHGRAVLAPALALASMATLGVAAPAHASAAPPLMSCAVTSGETFLPGVQMSPAPQSVNGVLHGSQSTPGPVCATAADGFTGLDATFTGQGQATCLPDPTLTTVNLTGTMTITWKKAGGVTGGTSQVNWTASQVDMGSVVFAGAVSSGQFTGAKVSVAGLSAEAVISVGGGCAAGSPLTSVSTADTYLKVT